MSTIADYVTKLASAAAGAVGKGEDLAMVEEPPQTAAAPAPAPPEWLQQAITVPGSFGIKSASHRMPFARVGMDCAFGDSRSLPPSGECIVVNVDDFKPLAA